MFFTIDVVSVGELKRSLSAGFHPNKIIFEGVGKSKEDLIYAIQQNIRLINAESLEEIKILESLALEKNKKVLCRVHNLSTNQTNQTSTDK